MQTQCIKAVVTR